MNRTLLGTALLLCLASPVDAGTHRLPEQGDRPRAFLLAGRLTPGEADRYLVRIRAGEWLTAAVLTRDQGELADPTLAALAPGASSPSAQSDDGGPGFLPRLAMQASTGGLLRLVVSGFGDADFDGSGHEEQFHYRLVVSVHPDGPGSDGGWPDLAKWPLLGARPKGGQLTRGETDVFELTLLPGTLLHAAVFAEGSGEFDDVVLRLFDADGALLAQNDDAGPGFLANLSYREPRDFRRRPARVSLELTGFDPEPADAAPHPEQLDYLLVLSAQLAP